MYHYLALSNMSLYHILFYAFFISSLPLYAGITGVKATVNIKTIQQDMVHISILTPSIKSDEILYIMPASIPGTYARMNFGYFVKNFQAYDKKGNVLPVRRENDNEFRIIGAKSLIRLEYDINDSYDDKTYKLDVFNPAGTNFQVDTNIMMGHQGFIGYFEGLQKIPYEIKVIKPSFFWGATSLYKKSISDTIDILSAKDYDELIDNPAMYSKPDSVSYMQGKTKITVAVYSTGGKVTAQMVAKALKPVTSTVEKFLGTMPVDRYTFILYFVGQERSDLRKREAYGALEHSYSSVYFLPESSDPKSLENWVAQTAVHEFLHILVPLNLHSKEIEHFDFKEPKMSKHLWLYEGVTEYFSVLAQAKAGEISEKTLLNRLRRKIISSKYIMPNPVSLSELALNVMQSEYQKLYPVIYEKGALIGLMLDIKLREISGDSITLLSLIRSLSTKFGPAKPFDDSLLFSIIEKETKPEITDFFRRFVDSTEEIQYEQEFAKIGFEYAAKKNIMSYTFSGIKPNVKTTEDDERPDTLRLYVKDTNNVLGAKQGDIVISVQGKNINLEQEDDEAYQALFSPQTDDEVIIDVNRNGQIITLKGKPKSSEKTEEFYLRVNPMATEAQKAFGASIFH
jgi:predicted metalloprotease with PDZ domain